MLRVYIKNYNEVRNVKLPFKVRKHCLSYSNIKSQKLSLKAWMLLANHLELKQIKLAFSKNGKPFDKNNHYFFSLSHSGDMVAIAISDKPVGIDIEKVRKLDNVNLIAKRILPKKTYAKFLSFKNKQLLLTKYWSKYEAIIKLYDFNLFNAISSKKEVKQKQIKKAKDVYFLSLAY